MDRTFIHNGKHFIIELDLLKNVVVKKLALGAVEQGLLETKLENEYDILKDSNIHGVRKSLSYRISAGLELEYVEGTDLRTFMDERVLSMPQKLALMQQVAFILGELHNEAGIIHKDINPSNILVKDDLSVVLIDFGISSRFTLRQPNLGNPERLEGTLLYLSPEQTGRMNRSVDYRTDLYSLGATMYEFFTGQAIFDDTDALDLVYNHLVKLPIPPSSLDSLIPEMVSKILLKLLEKVPENRYQSAWGLAKDLGTCLDALKEGQALSGFELGKEDYTGRLQIPEKLYGREDETQLVLDSFDRVMDGTVELIMVAGYSGTGKSVLVSETHRPLTATKGYFVEGKFDQFKRNIPFYAWIQAFKSFVDLLLTENNTSLVYWTEIIQEALGENGSVLTEVIPNLEVVIGLQPTAPKLSGHEAQNRFNYVMQNFIKAITNKEHPLVIFIDDLQWADLASLNLLKTLVTDRDNAYLLCTGAYRDNEVTGAHPLMDMLKAIEEETSNMSQVSIGNLGYEAVLDMLSEALNHPKDLKLSQLNHIILSKTQGNAFFTHQFLRNLYEEKLLQFDFTQRCWIWNVDQIEQAEFTDNVVELMSKKVTGLPKVTRDLLELAACIGNQFELTVLEIIAAQKGIKKELDKGIAEGLIFPVAKGWYKFVHDRIQQAAYLLIPKEQKQITHLKIGRLLYQSFSKEERQNHLFDLVSHYNLAADILDTTDKQIALQLNIEAAQKAKLSASFDGMLSYVRRAYNFLSLTAWEDDYALTLTVHELLAEAEHMNANKEELDWVVAEVLAHAKKEIDTIEVLLIDVAQKISDGRANEAIDTIRQPLLGWGIVIPYQEQIERVNQQLLSELTQKLRVIGIDGLIALPRNDSTESILIAQLLLKLGLLGAIFNNVALFRFGYFKGFELSLENGNTPQSPIFYSISGGFMTQMLGDYNWAYDLTHVGIRLAREFDNKLSEGQILMNLGIVDTFKNPFREARKYALLGVQICLDAGDLNYLGYSIASSSWLPFLEGQPLDVVEQELVDRFLPMTINHQLDVIQHWIVGLHWILDALTRKKGSIEINKKKWAEAEWLDIGKAQNNGLSLGTYHPYQTFVELIFEQFDQAWEQVKAYQPYEATATNFYPHMDAPYYHALAYLKQYEKSPQKEYLEKVEEYQLALKRLVDSFKDNFWHKYQLVAAERARVLNGEMANVMDLYDDAITSAQKNEFIQEAALACECCARYLSHIGKERMAKAYWLDAYQFYQQWGAEAKLEQLREKHHTIFPVLDDRITMNTQSSTTMLSTEHLDLQTVLMSTQSLSKQVHTKELINEMLQVLAKNSGANKITLLRKQGEEWHIVADMLRGEEQIQKALALSKYTELPLSAINFVLRNREWLLLHDASTDNRFAQDAYVQRKKSRSMLIVPIEYKGELVAIIYLANRLIVGAFNQQRYALVNALTVQLAISLENTLLYESLEDKVEERTQEIEQQKQKIEKLYKSLSSSITYAKRIQDALLPNLEGFSEIMPENFVFLRPRDVVSGDFYWYTKFSRQTDYVVVAVADCTGHGVPGAFMSMLGSTFLDGTVSYMNAKRPGQVLNELRSMIKVALKQSNESGGNKDGMDMVLYSIDLQKKMLYFAGANNPLYIIRPNGAAHNMNLPDRIKMQEQNGHLLMELKADKHPVGIYPKQRPFTTQVVQLQAGDLLYAFSDGFIDQIGGERGNKLRTKNFKKVLLQYCSLPMSRQCEILEQIIRQWMGTEHRQVDDMLILGVKI